MYKISFKPGDKVICANSKDTKYLKRSQIYTVSKYFMGTVKCEYDRISLCELPNNKYNTDRFFILPKNHFKNGDKVVAIDIGHSNFIVKGKIYTVRDYNIKIDNYDEFEEMITIYENGYNYFKDRFVLLSEYRKQKLQKICSK